MGGIDKHVVRRSREEITAELEYKIPPRLCRRAAVFSGSIIVDPQRHIACELQVLYREKRGEIMEREAGAQHGSGQEILTKTLTFAALIVLGTILTLPFFWLLSDFVQSPASRIQQWPPDILPMQPVHARVAGKETSTSIMTGTGAELALIERLKDGMARVQAGRPHEIGCSHRQGR